MTGVFKALFLTLQLEQNTVAGWWKHMRCMYFFRMETKARVLDKFVKKKKKTYERGGDTDKAEEDKVEVKARVK